VHLLVDKEIAECLDKSGGVYHKPDKSQDYCNPHMSFSIYAHKSGNAGGRGIIVPGNPPKYTGWFVQRGTKLDYYLKRCGPGSRKYERLYEIAKRIGRKAARHHIASGAPYLKINTRRGLWFSTGNVERCFESSLKHGFDNQIPDEMRFHRTWCQWRKKHIEDYRFSVWFMQSDLAIYVLIRDGELAYEKWDSVESIVQEMVKADNLLAAVMQEPNRESVSC